MIYHIHYFSVFGMYSVSVSQHRFIGSAVMYGRVIQRITVLIDYTQTVFTRASNVKTETSCYFMQSQSVMWNMHPLYCCEKPKGSISLLYK